MSTFPKLFIIIIGFILVAGGILLTIYLLRGGEGESTNIPTNPDAAATELR